MADFILSREIGPETKFTSVAKAREKRRRYLADLFQPIEQALLAPGGGGEVLYAITSRGMGWCRPANAESADSFEANPDKAIRDFQAVVIPLNSHDVNVAAAFTANRCIITTTQKAVRVPIRTVPYDDIVKIEPTAGKYSKLNLEFGEMTLMTATGNGVAFQTMPISAKDRYLYREFVPEQACEAVTELVMKYKQARYAAQQGAAAPQYRQQTPPPQAAPQYRQQTPPQVPRAAAPAAPRAGAGLTAEAVEALKQFKELLDMGIVTQEEFDAKKRQLLGL